MSREQSVVISALCYLYWQHQDQSSHKSDEQLFAHHRTNEALWMPCYQHDRAGEGIKKERPRRDILKTDSLSPATCGNLSQGNGIDCEFWPWAKFLLAVNKLMGDTLKWVDFSLINVWYGNLPSGQTPTKVPRLELTEEMEGSLNFLSPSSFSFLFFFLIYWQSRVLNSGTNILISCPWLSSLWPAWNNSGP